MTLSTYSVLEFRNIEPGVLCAIDGITPFPVIAPIQFTRSTGMVREAISEPRLRQKKFPSRTRSIRRIPDPSRKLARQQQTLTQIDFARSMSSGPRTQAIVDEMEVDMEVGVDEDDFEAPRPAKRRRKARFMSEEEKRKQKTLTQIGFFVGDSTDDEDDAPFQILQDPAPQENVQPWYNSIFDSKKHEHTSSGDPNTPTCMPASEHVTSTTDPLQAHNGIPQTPARPTRYEVPSSQSPIDSPGLTQSNTPSQAQRTPLQEILPNILARRDEESPTKTQRTTLRSHVSDSTVAESDQENYDPGYAFEAFGKGKHRECQSQTAIRDWADSTSTQPLISSTFGSTDGFKRPLYPLSQLSPLRLSQISTIEGTPLSAKSPTRCPPSPSPTRPPVSSLFDCSSSLGTADSLPRKRRLADITPMASLNDSADITTATQMMPSSYLG